METIYIIKKVSKFNLHTFQAETKEKAAQKSTCLKVSDFAEMTEAQYNSIVDKYYNIGTEEEPQMIDLHLVSSIKFKEKTGDEIHDQITNIYFKNRDNAIQAYKDEQTDKSFRCKKLKLVIPDYDLLIGAGFEKMSILVDKNPSILKDEPISIGEEETRRTELSIYLDYIKIADRTPIQAAIDAGLIDEYINPTRDGITVIINENE